MTRLVLAVFIALLLVAIGLLAGGTEPPALAAMQGVTDQACLECHQGLDLAGAPHEVLVKTIAGGSCEACHGPAGEHARGALQNPMLKDVGASKIAALCFACHKSGPDHVVRWADSAFAKAGQSCADCHKVHEKSQAHLSFKADEAGNLGEAACRMCHAPVFAAFGSSFHAPILGKPGAGCEACHGPGKAHAEGAAAFLRGKGPANIVREPEAKACLLCHRAIPDRHAREKPVYREKRPACVVCHDVHVNRDDPIYSDVGSPGALLGKTAGNAACLKCHVKSVESAQASVHGPVVADPEKGCEACHGPLLAHVKSGGRTRFVVNPLKLTPEKAAALCLGCHEEAPDHAKSWAGGPLEAQGLSCLTCHEAHGKEDAQGRPFMPSGAGEPVAGRNVGSKTCKICHAEAHPEIQESPHARLLTDLDAAGCEACHGPGSGHVMQGGAPEAIRNPGRLPEARQSEFCLTCHKDQTSRFAWDRGEHARAGLECTTCHDPLRNRAKSAIKKEPDLCLACHGEVRAQFKLPNRHPLDRGAVNCTSCHNPHSEIHGFLSLAARKERCVKCHTDKSGPFLFEHEASRTDGCIVCHRPHGSTNRRLLTHRNVRDLCVQCHVTPASHNQASGSPFRNCLNCHGSIHGSYVHKKFLR